MDLEGRGGYQTTDFENFDPYLTGKLSAGYMGDNWGIAPFAQYNVLNKNLNVGARADYGPGFIQGSYDLGTNSPLLSAGLSFSFEEGGEIDLDEETINELIAAGADIEIL